jgi:hypothetical protein
MGKDPWKELEREIARARLAALIPGGQLPREVGGMKLHSAQLDPLVPGRIRISYRAPDYVEVPENV